MSQRYVPDLTYLEGMIKSLDNIAEHKVDIGEVNTDLLYYKLLSDNCRAIMEAQDKSGVVAGCSAFAPTEICYAMDIVPANLIFMAWSMGLTLKKTTEFLSAAESYGLTWDCCSGHRAVLGANVRRAFPRVDLVIGTSWGCNNIAASARHVASLQGCPVFYVDMPYYDGEAEVKYFTNELKELICFLEKHTGRKMDWDRLSEAVALAKQSADLWREIRELRKAVPAPIRSRSYMRQYWIDMFYSGAPQAVEFMQAVRDEVKSNVEKGRGPCPKEKYRLITLLLPPQHSLKIFDWMERERGAVSAMEIHCSHCGETELDPSKPLESLAHKYFQHCNLRHLHGPIDKLLQDTVQDAIAYKADGAIYWALATCHTTPSTGSMIRDKLLHELDIPTLMVDTDSTDPTYRTLDELKNQIDVFLETIDARKA